MHKQNSNTWIQTRTGSIDLLDPQPEDVNIEDIAFALSNLCRFTGHVPFYSVAQHSVLVYDICKQQCNDKNILKAALLHDAAEAYLGDVSTPLKNAMAVYKAIEHRMQAVIGQRFGVVLDPMHEMIVGADRMALAIEKRDLLPEMDWGFKLPNIASAGWLQSYVPCIALDMFNQCWREVSQ
jgi:hypothetical protein